MMRVLAMLRVVVVLVLGTVALADPAAGRTFVFRVGGMTCALCAKAIEKALQGVDGVRSIAVDQKAERVAIVADPTIGAERLERTIEGAGPYHAEPAE